MNAGSTRRRAWLCCLALASSMAGAQEIPRPPCGAPPAPAYSAVDGPASVTVLRGKDAAAWMPPGCTGWSAAPRDLVVAVSGTFRHDGSARDLMARIGAITALRGTRYWSVSDHAWRELITDAVALSDADPANKRPDFSAEEIASGRELVSLQAERRLGEAVYRLRLRESSPERIVVESENVTPLRLMLLPLFRPGELKSVNFIERRGPGAWGYYALVSATSAFARQGEASLVNRSVALYQRFAQVPADARVAAR